MFSGVGGDSAEVSHPEFIHSGDSLSWFIHSFTQRLNLCLKSLEFKPSGAALSTARGPRS